MQKRLQSIKRVIAVQEQLRRLAEGKLADLARREAGLHTSRRELVGALNEDQALHGLFIEAMARRVTSLSKDLAKVERAKEVQAKHLREETGRLKRAERIAGSLDREYQAALDKKELAELIDHLVSQGTPESGRSLAVGPVRDDGPTPEDAGDGAPQSRRASLR
ncbi:hypothetical protein SAMN05519104_2637 [Rhizobiales bacterium GAS188]|jgi:hypothetical protein|nr:hypothetical protein SAMN05519104_2637 [Rhizobiales bacterium GAS188]